MPTIKQLMTSIESQIEFPETRHPDDPMYVAPKQPLVEFTGEVIGEIVFDKENGDFKIIPANPQTQVIS